MRPANYASTAARWPSQAARPPYRIGPPDILLVEMTVEPGKDQPVRGQHLVQPDGTIGLGIFGSVYVAGMSLEETRQAIARKLDERIKRVDGKVPHVAVDMLAYNSQCYYIMTEGKGLGDEFRQSIENALDRISRAPELHAVILKGVRRSFVRRFPYAIFYLAEEARVVVIAVMHTRRNPLRWKKRI